MRESLAATAVQSALTTRWLGRSYTFMEQVGSTNSLLKQRLARESTADLPHGTVLLTDFQETGRGRMDRRWEAPPGTSLLFSVLLRPDWPPERAMWLTMLAGLAVVDAVTAVTELTVALKWPNDVVARQAGRWVKVCGLLTEGELDEWGRLAAAVVGIGLNANIPQVQLPEAAFPAASLLTLTGQPVDRLQLLVALLGALEQRYDAAASGRSPQPEWNARLMTLGQPVIVTGGGSAPPVRGTAVGTSADGQLLVRDVAGAIQIVNVGDVSLRHG